MNQPENGVNTETAAYGTTQEIKINMAAASNIYDTSNYPVYATLYNTTSTVQVTFWPGITGFEVAPVSPNWASISWGKSGEPGYDYECVLPVRSTPVLTLGAWIGMRANAYSGEIPDPWSNPPRGPYTTQGWNAVSSDLSWKANRNGVVAVTPVTVDPEHVIFGFDGEKRRSFMFSQPIEGDRVDIFVTLTKAATGNGTAEESVKKILVKFADIQEPMSVTPSPVVFKDGVEQTIVTTVAPTSGLVMTDLKAAGVGESNGITVSVSGNTVTFSGRPTAPGTATFVLSAVIDGVLKTMYYVVSIEENTERPALNAVPDTLSGKEGEMLSDYVTVSTWPAGAILTGVTVEPATWNGLAATPGDNRILLSGVPAGAGSQSFTVSARVNGDLETATFTVRVTGGEKPTPQGDIFSPSIADWEGSCDSSTRELTLSTALLAGTGVSESDIASVLPLFRDESAVENATARIKNGRLAISCRMAEGCALEDIVLNGVVATLNDGTVLSQNLNIEAEALAASDEKESGGGCSLSSPFPVLFLLPLLSLISLNRRPGRRTKHLHP